MDKKQLHMEFMSILGESHPGLTFEEYRDSCVFLLFYKYCCLRFGQELDDSYKLKEMVRMAVRGKLQIPSFLKFIESASAYIHRASGQFELTEFSFYRKMARNQSQEKQKSFARFIRKIIKKIDAWDCDPLLFDQYPVLFEEMLGEFAQLKKETYISEGVQNLYRLFFAYSDADAKRLVLPGFQYGILFKSMFKEEIDAVFEDIYPDAVKIGMVSSTGLIEVIGERLGHYGAKNIVVDPVMVATSGSRLIDEEAVETLEKELLPLAALITPNIPEAEILMGHPITSEDDMENAAKDIFARFGCGVLIKGGHSISDANDVLFDGKAIKWFHGKRIDNPNTHGTGCTLSSAIAANLAKGFDLETSVERAKAYISGALAAMLDLGHGSGPLKHNFDLTGEFAKEADDAEAESEA